MEDSKDFECSFLICTYRPEWEKLRLTLKACLMQKDCRCQLVVTDDGSENNLFDEVEAYLRENSFSDYELVAAPHNQGTVKNVMQGLKACRGTYVKTISSGDFMHGQKTMRRWLDFMDEHDDCAMTFGDAIYYHFADGMLVPTVEYAHPQCVDICGGDGS